MEIENLPERLVDFVINSKHNSGTIRNDIYDALKNANSVGEFEINVTNAMIDIIAECKSVINNLLEGGGQ